MFALRAYQQEVNNKIDTAYSQGNNIVMPVLPTGAGKTILFTHRINDFRGTSLAMAHRAELVSQVSLSLARSDIPHRIIGPPPLVKRCAKLHMMALNKHYINSNAPVACASVQTLDHKDFDKRYPVFSNMLRNVGQWICDEGHHLLKGNAWGRVIEKMPDARGLAPTATPERADGKGLGAHADGVVDCLVEGPTQRDLIDWGYLSDYQIYAPDPAIDLEDVEISSTTGDYNQTQLRNAAHKQKTKLVGDLVSHYFTWAPGKLAICFVPDLESAANVCEGFIRAGVRAAVISSKTDPILRAQIMTHFEQGEIQVVVNVDILGEGVDVPGVECIIMGRPTDSFSLFNQQAGRALRILEGKEFAIIIDAVGNIRRHARVVEYPDGRVLIDLSRGSWSLDGREKSGRGKTDPDELKMIRCAKCTRPFAGTSPVCPTCGHNNAPEPSKRNIKNVDGDLTLLSPQQLSEMQGSIDQHILKYAAAASAQQRNYPKGAYVNDVRRVEAQKAQDEIQNAIRYFGGFHLSLGRDWGEIYRRFYNRYQIDVINAQGLPYKEAQTLCLKICNDLAERRI